MHALVVLGGSLSFCVAGGPLGRQQPVILRCTDTTHRQNKEASEAPAANRARHAACSMLAGCAGIGEASWEGALWIDTAECSVKQEASSTTQALFDICGPAAAVAATATRAVAVILSSAAWCSPGIIGRKGGCSLWTSQHGLLPYFYHESCRHGCMCNGGKPVCRQLCYVMPCGHVDGRSTYCPARRRYIHRLRVKEVSLGSFIVSRLGVKHFTQAGPPPHNPCVEITPLKAAKPVNSWLYQLHAAQLCAHLRSTRHAKLMRNIIPAFSFGTPAGVGEASWVKTFSPARRSARRLQTAFAL